MTTSPVPSITDELLAELEGKAKAAIEDGIEEGFDYDPSIGMTLGETRFACAANPTTILALIAHIRSLEARLKESTSALSRIADRAGAYIDDERDMPCEGLMRVLAIAQEGADHE